MPSWNIHIAQTERLLGREGAAARCVANRDIFLFGNVVPDVYVGYMVPGASPLIPYGETHLAKSEPIPKPREHEFWERFVAPRAGALTQGAGPERDEFDLVLGAWAHLMADCLWNTRVNEYLDAHGGKPSESFRIKKQGDFDWFGKTLPISSVPAASPELYAACAAFPQYPVGRDAVNEAIEVTRAIVAANPGTPEHPPYRLLTDAFFDRVFTEVIDTTDRALQERLAL